MTTTRATLAAVFWLGSSGLPTGCASLPTAIADGTPLPTTLAVYALSKGKGVPPETRAALARVRAVLDEVKGQGGIEAVTENRLGLEGETKVCVQFKDANTARDVRERLRAIAAEVTLLNVVAEPCRTTE